jgi:ABC-2 type transport system ATP-binding protein
MCADRTNGADRAGTVLTGCDHHRAGPVPGARAPVIEVRDLVKRYRGAPANAVDGISFEVAPGQLFCLLGPNGAGKTTTVSVLTTTLAPTSGTVIVAGQELPAHQAQVRRELGVVFQQPSLDLNLTAEENIRMHAVLYGLCPWRPAYRLMPAGYRRTAGELASVMGIAEALHRRARSLSGGMRRKLEIVRALMHRPSVLFLDEPTAGLDPESRRSLWQYLRQARASYGTTIVLTTHYLEEAEAADAVCIMAGGAIVERGTPAEVKARHTAPVLLVDAPDRERLRRELAALGLTATPGPPLRVPLDGQSPQRVLRALTSDLTHIQIIEPSLEDAYLMLLERPS